MVRIAVQVLEVIVGHEPRVAAGDGVRCGQDLEVVGIAEPTAALATNEASIQRPAKGPLLKIR